MLTVSNPAHSFSTNVNNPFATNPNSTTTTNETNLARADEHGHINPRPDGNSSRMSIDDNRPTADATPESGPGTSWSSNPRKTMRSGSDTLDAGEAKRIKTDPGKATEMEDVITDWHCW